MGLSACKEKAPLNLEVGDLHGNWSIYEATRRGKPTKTLLGTYFDFSTDSVTTNLFTGSSAYPFKLVGSTIHLDKNQPLMLEVESLRNDSLYITTSFKNFDFEFYLKRNE